MERVGVFKKNNKRNTVGLSQSSPHPRDTWRLLWPFYHSDAKSDQISGLYLTSSAAQRLYRPARHSPSTTRDWTPYDKTNR